jgi:uncharacterized membrane protein
MNMPEPLIIPVPEATNFPRVRRDLPPLSALQWLRYGAADFRANTLASMFYGLCFTLVGVLFVLAFQFAVQLITALTTGFMLVGPVFAMGLYELSRQREMGKPAELKSSLLVWRQNMGGIGLYSLILIVLYLVWARASLVVFAIFYEGGIPNMEGFITQMLALENLEFMLAYMAIGAFFAVLVFAFSVVSIPLMLDRRQDAITAMLASFIALTGNLPAMLVWGFLIVSLTAIGVVTAFMGLIVTMPIIGHATWHAYRALIDATPPKTSSIP